MGSYEVVEVYPLEDGSGFAERPYLGTKTLTTELDEDQSLEVGDIIQAETAGLDSDDYEFRSATGGGGSPTVWGKVIRELQYADPEGTPVEGYDTYKVRLLTTDIDAWSASYGTYLEDDLVMYGDDDYIYEAIIEHESDIGNHPSGGESDTAFWRYVEDIEPGGIATEGDYLSTDLRYWGRWFTIDDIIPIVRRDGDWYIYQTLIPLGALGTQSLSWNGTDNRLMAVFR